MATDEHDEKTGAKETKRSDIANPIFDFFKKKLKEGCYDVLGLIFTGIALCVLAGELGYVGVTFLLLGIIFGVFDISFIGWWLKNPKKTPTTKEQADDKTQQPHLKEQKDGNE